MVQPVNRSREFGGRLVKLAFVIATALVAAGCTTTRSTDSSTAGASSARLIYPLTEEQALKVLGDSMLYQFPDSPIARVDLPSRGFTVTERFLLDSQTFTARVVSAKGQGPAGQLVEGFYFEVRDSGTMPISGSVRAKSLFEKITENAQSLAKPVSISSVP